MTIWHKNVAESRFRKPLKYLAVSALAAVCITGVIACAPNSSSAETSNETTSEQAVNVDASSESTTETISANTTSMDFEYSDRDQDPSYDEAEATAITLSNSDAEIEGDGATADSNVVTITEEGTYVVSGTSSNCQIVIAADDESKVQLVLDGVDITCESGPCINITGGDKVFITLAEGSSNTLSDGGWTITGESDEANATIYSTSDLTLNGTGELTVNATVYHGISSKDDLVITGGTYTINAANDGLRGKDCVKILDGTFTINASEDGIVSSNDSDEDRGFVSIDGGTFNISAGDDGIQATRYIRTVGGNITIDAADDALHSDLDLLQDGANLVIDAGDDAVHGEFNVHIASGTLRANSCYEGIEGESVLVSGGENTVYADDDAINAVSGTTDATDETAEESAAENATNDATDEELAAAMEEALSADNADSSAPEATEQNSTESSGDMEEQAPSDMEQAPAEGGMQPGEPPSGNMEAGQFGGGMMDGDGIGDIVITGGETVLICTQDGDSLDANGSLSMTGGVVLISGTTGNGNGVFDYVTGGSITGGTILALGSSGMAMSFDSSSTQASVVTNVDGSADDLVSIVDGDGNVVISYRAVNDFSWLLASSENITDGSEYEIVIGGSNADANDLGYATSGVVNDGATAASATASTESQGMGMMGGMGGGMPQGGGPQGDAGNAPQGGEAPQGMDGAPQGGEMPQDMSGSSQSQTSQTA